MRLTEPKIWGLRSRRKLTKIQRPQFDNYLILKRIAAIEGATGPSGSSGGESRKRLRKVKGVTPEEYMREIVDPTLRDFASNPTSRRHAFIACVVTFHAIDYLAGNKPKAIVRAEYRRQSHAFVAIDLIAHARDHHLFDRRQVTNVMGGQITAFRQGPDPESATAVVLQLVNEAADFLRNQIRSQSARHSSPQNDTYYVVIPFDRSSEGNICPGAAQVVVSAAAAHRRARTLASAHAGAIAFSRAGDPATGEFDDAIILARFGDVDLKTLGR